MGCNELLEQERYQVIILTELIGLWLILINQNF